MREEGRPHRDRSSPAPEGRARGGRRRPVGVYWGRFNPPHRGHLGVIRRFQDRYRLLVAIGSAEHRNERRNPFSGNERKAMMEALLQEAGVDGVRVTTLADGPSVRGSVENLVRRCRPDAVILSTERRGSLDAALARAGVRVARFRRTGTVSSTRVRDSIAGGTEEWRRLTGEAVATLIEQYDGPERIRRSYGRAAGRTLAAGPRARSPGRTRPLARRPNGRPGARGHP